jgi:hypothetical protein
MHTGIPTATLQNSRNFIQRIPYTKPQKIAMHEGEREREGGRGRGRKRGEVERGNIEKERGKRGK